MFDGVKLLDVVGPAEAFAEASRLGADYHLRYVSVTGASVQTSIGASFAVNGTVADVHRADLVVVPGGDDVPTTPIPPETRSAVAHLMNVTDRVTSVCTGTFLLADSGALDGRRVTTHWEHAPLLARAHPAVRVDSNAIFVHDGPFHTSAGVTSGIDLTLAMIEADHGADLARDVARRLVVHMRRPGGQSQYSTLLETSHSTQEAVRRVIDAVIAHPEDPYRLTKLARIAGVSTRHLSRLFRAELGLTPLEFVEQARFEAAKHLLLGGIPVAEVARRCGFGSPETMRRLFVDRVGVPPRQYQQRFISADSPVGSASSG